MLRRWQALHRVLEERYRAPELVDWVALPGSSMQGALFRHLAGSPPDFERTPELLPAVLALCGRLHGDGDLRAALGGLGPPAPRSLADAFCDTYIARFDEDLAAVAAERPPFVTDAVLSWMERETRRLERMVREAAAFAGPAVSPVHGDLQANNLLLTGSGEWYVLDWDDLDLGDPALDYTVLLWPRLRMQPAGVWRDHPLPGAADAALSARMTLYLRAKLLDDVIDVLADWVEATTVPERLTEIREQKRGEHEWARALYRQWYGV
jgi:hypothetical protein